MVSLKNKLESFEKSAIIYALVECDWVMAKAARQLGITERMIGYKIKKYGIREVHDAVCKTCEVKKVPNKPGQV